VFAAARLAARADVAEAAANAVRDDRCVDSIRAHNTPRKRPLFVADERTQLVGWLDPQRPIVHMKGEGLSETDGEGRMAVERG
jgi:hypothetical protein